MKLFLLTLILFLNIGCFNKKPNTYKSISFKYVGGWPLVKAKINNTDAWLILDTGAAGDNLFNITDSAKYKIKFDDYYIMSLGIGGAGFARKVEDLNIKIADKEIESDFISQDLNNLFDMFERNHNIRVNGIIGGQIFNRYKAIINYNNKTITFLE